jgi:hypothetical protein
MVGDSVLPLKHRLFNICYSLWRQFRLIKVGEVLYKILVLVFVMVLVLGLKYY